MLSTKGNRTQSYSYTKPTTLSAKSSYFVSIQYLISGNVSTVITPPDVGGIPERGTSTVVQMETPHGMESQPSQHRRSAGHTLARASQGKRSGDHPVSAQCTAAPRESQSRSFHLSLSEGLHLHIHTPRTFTHAVPPTAPLPARNPLEGNRFCYFKVPGT